MAVVRFSSEFKDAIVSNARAVFQPRIEKLRAAVPQVGDEVMALVYAPLMPLFNNVPKEFLRWDSSFELVRIGMTRYNLSYKASTNYPRPDSKIVVGNAEVTGNYRMEVTLQDVPEYAHIKQQLDDYVSGVKALEAQRDEFVAGVKKVVEAHSTLAPALKAWPPLWDLVPEEYRERHRKVVERTKPEASEIDVDLSKLTATVAVHKMVK